MDKGTAKHSFMALFSNMYYNNIKLEKKYHDMFGSVLNEISNGYEKDDKPTQLKALENLYQAIKD